MNIQNILSLCNSHRIQINLYLGRHEPLKLVLISVFTSLYFYWFYDFLHREESLKKRFLKSFFKFVHKLPVVKSKIEKEISKNVEHLESGFHNSEDGPLIYRLNLPEIGFSHEDVIKETAEYLKLNKVDWKEGYVSGTVYVDNENLNKLLLEVYERFLWTNPLHPDTFPDVRKMEAEIVRMCCNIYNGNAVTCGTTTCGGTESIMLAIKTYRDIAIDRGVRIPEMIVPITAHAAFDKAAQYFRMKIHHARIDPVTMKADVYAMKRLINRNTCVLVASAPHYPHGIVDPVAKISELGQKYNIPVHVDCCLGGFLLPFMEAAGCPLDEQFDFRLPGVTSISCDTHKYGFAPKGSSVVLYRSHEYLRHQIFVQPDWPGGVYASPTFAGSRPGVIIATCWSTMMFFGYKGYVDSTREIVQTTIKIRDAIKNIPGLYVLGDPKVCVVSIASDEINVYNLLDGLRKCGWQLNPLQFPLSIHIAVTHIHCKKGVADKFIQDVKKETALLMKLPGPINEGSAAIYGMAQSIPDRSLVSDIAAAFIAACYSTKNQ